MNTANPLHNGVYDLVLSAGPVGKLVLVFLLLVSVFCWAVIFTKFSTLKTASRENGKFLAFFWQSKSIDDIFLRIDQYSASPIAAVFRSGMKELRKLTGSADTSLANLELDNISRALSRSANDELAHLERNVTWLATTASAAPFVGLFGTVWGIMASFQSIGASGSANLAVVAPGISEALITTAMGILAAIPAAIFYNYFLNRIKRIALETDGFNQDFLNIIRRSQIMAENNVAIQVPPSGGSSRAQTVLSEINVTPLVDVMLVLLIVFMISAPLMQQGVQVDLPKANAGSLSEAPEQVVLVVSKSHAITLNGTNVPSGGLRPKLAAIYKARPDVQIFIQADQSVAYGFIAQVMAEVKQAKITRVGLVTEPGDANSRL